MRGKGRERCALVPHESTGATDRQTMLCAGRMELCFRHVALPARWPGGLDPRCARAHGPAPRLLHDAAVAPGARAKRPHARARARLHACPHAHESVAQLVGDRVLNTTTRRGSAALQQSFQAGFWCAGATAPSGIARVRLRVLCARAPACACVRACKRALVCMCECANSPAASGANNSLGRGVPVLVFANLGAELIQLVRGRCLSSAPVAPAWNRQR
jgi:hypothetical protein